MNWQELLLEKRERYARSTPRPGDLRSEFEKDYHRIIGSASFRRLQDKTQVFPLDKSDFIRTRLTHSLEVSSFARSLGQSVGAEIIDKKLDPAFGERQKENISDILQCAGLIHDIGNPPFGHFGELCIRCWFKENLPKLKFRDQPVTDLLTEWMCQDFYHFEGNAQALRLLSRLHFLVDEHGMNLTYGLLSSIIKYPVSSMETDAESDDITRHKIGYFYADRELFDDLMSSTGLYGHRNPLAFLLEAADDIAYKTADLEDAFKKGFISFYDLLMEIESIENESGGEDAPPGSAYLKRLYQKGKETGTDEPELYAAQNWIVALQSYLLNSASNSFIERYDELMEGSCKADLFHGTKAERIMDLLGDMGFRYVFDTEFIYKLELATGEIYDYLLNRLVHACIYYDTEYWEQSRTPSDHKLMSIISDNYKRAYASQSAGKPEGEKLYLRLLLVTDYISGMTDSYAKNLYQDIRGIR